MIPDKRKKIINIILILTGITFDAFGTAVFLLPQGFVVGGVTGLGRVINHLTGIDVSYAVGAISIALLATGFLTLGYRFAMSIVAGSLLFPIMLNLFERFDMLTHLTSQPMLAALFAGLSIGLGLGLIIRAGASSGGGDVLAIILSRKLGWSVAPLLYATDVTIMALQLPFADSEQVLYGIAVSLFYTIALNKIVLAGPQVVQVTVISPEFERINLALQTELDLGSTLTHSRTGHLGNEIDVIMCVTDQKSVYALKQTVLGIDPEAFITMVNVSGVNGRGFSLVRRYR